MTTDAPGFVPALLRRESNIQTLLKARASVLEDLEQMPALKVGSQWEADRRAELGRYEAALRRLALSN